MHLRLWQDFAGREVQKHAPQPCCKQTPTQYEFHFCFCGRGWVAEATADVVWDLAQKLLLETANESQSCQGTPPQQRQNMIICICAFRRTPKSRILRLKTGLMPEIETCRRNFGNRKSEIPFLSFEKSKSQGVVRCHV